MKRLIQRFQNAYEALVVLMIVGVAAVLIYALYAAMGGSGSGYSIAVTFNDVDGLKERSKVLFNGMPVGTVSKMAYDKDANLILVRLDIDKSADIPTNVQAFLESSLFGEAHVALKTKEKPTQELLASAAVEESRDLTKLYRIEGKALSKAESVMPGFNQTMIEVKDATEVARDKLVEFSDEVTARLRGPVQNSLDELEKIIKGPEGQ
jgi:ABC-type transporter Mla subunit MlaD